MIPGVFIIDQKQQQQQQRRQHYYNYSELYYYWSLVTDTLKGFYQGSIVTWRVINTETH